MLIYQAQSAEPLAIEIEAPTTISEDEDDDDAEVDASSNNPLRQPAGSGPRILVTCWHMTHDCCPYFRITGSQGEILIHGDGLLPVPGRSWWCATLQ
jgi:hypothetical protein